jgi:hypothetical protein
MSDVTCRVCGCTDDHACNPPCAWFEPGLCTTCALAAEVIGAWTDAAVTPSLTNLLNEADLKITGHLLPAVAENAKDAERLRYMFGDPENGASHEDLKRVWENATTLEEARAMIDALRADVAKAETPA